MNKRITIYDLAKMLDVSPTTVYKALNGKPKVGEKTRSLILKTAQEMGFKANIAAKSLARKTIRIGVVIDSSFPVFHDEILRGAMAACEELTDFKVMGEYYSASGPNRNRKILEKIDELLMKGVDGILLSPGVDIRGYEEKFTELSQMGIATATVVSDVPYTGRAFCVRYDGNMGGRIAAQLLSWIVKTREVSIFTGNGQVQIHRETTQGFTEEAGKQDLEVVAIYENQDDENIAYYATEKLLADFPDIGGIYVNSANSLAVCRKIIEKGYEKKVAIVTSDIFPELSEYIKRGIVSATIFQDPFRQGRLAFKKLYEYISGDRERQEDVIIPPQILIESNMEAYLNFRN
jgi:LacI family transcriptional regulator